MLLCPFEDAATVHLRPLVDTRPVYALRLGLFSPLDLFRKLIRANGVVLHARPYLAAAANAEHGLPVNRLPENVAVLFVNGRYVPQKDALLDRINRLEGGSGVLLMQDDTLVAAYLPEVPAGFRLPEFVTAELFGSLPVEQVSTHALLSDVPGLIHGVHHAIARDFDVQTENRRQIERAGTVVQDGAHLIEPDALFLAPGATVRAGAVLDASEGPIYLDENAAVMPGAVVRGPVYVGVGSRINALASVEGVAIGPGCKVGGEVHTTIFHSFSNKAHQGFVGHTYVGRWCNFGADTNTSNLRNDYGPVSLYDYAAGDFVDSGKQFLGLALGDHSRCAIDTTFNTGTVVGVGCNLYGPGFHDRFVPAFSWGEPGAYAPYRLDKFLRVAEIVMPRRDRTLTDVERDMLAYLHHQAMAARSID